MEASIASSPGEVEAIVAANKAWEVKPRERTGSSRD
jgi:hypothetical protein